MLLNFGKPATADAEFDMMDGLLLAMFDAQVYQQYREPDIHPHLWRKKEKKKGKNPPQRKCVRFTEYKKLNCDLTSLRTSTAHPSSSPALDSAKWPVKWRGTPVSNFDLQAELACSWTIRAPNPK